DVGLEILGKIQAPIDKAEDYLRSSGNPFTRGLGGLLAGVQWVGFPEGKLGKLGKLRKCEKAAEELKAAQTASQIDRAAFKLEREAFWKAEAENNAAKYSAEDLEKMRNGRAPTGSDGYPIELHHVDRTAYGGLEPMTRTDHRLGDNYMKNHP